MNTFYNKYLKYKTKYTELKNKIGGDYRNNSVFNLVESIGFEFECKFLFRIVTETINQSGSNKLISCTHPKGTIPIFNDNTDGDIILDIDTVSIPSRVTMNPYVIVNINYTSNETDDDRLEYKITKTVSNQTFEINMNGYYNHTEFIYTIPHVSSFTSIINKPSNFYYYTLLFYKIIAEFFNSFTEIEILNNRDKIAKYIEGDTANKEGILKNLNYAMRIYNKINLYKHKSHNIAFLAFENNSTSILNNIKTIYNKIMDLEKIQNLSKIQQAELISNYKKLTTIPFAQQITIGAKLSNIGLIFEQILENQYQNDRDDINLKTLILKIKSEVYEYLSNIKVEIPDLPDTTLLDLQNLFFFIFYELYKESKMLSKADSYESYNLHDVKDTIEYIITIRYKGNNGCDFILRHPYNIIMKNILIEWLGIENVSLNEKILILQTEIKRALFGFELFKLDKKDIRSNFDSLYKDYSKQNSVLKDTLSKNAMIDIIKKKDSYIFSPNIDNLVEELFKEKSDNFIHPEHANKTHLGTNIVPMPTNTDISGTTYKTILLEFRTFDYSVNEEIRQPRINITNEVSELKKYKFKPKIHAEYKISKL